MLSGPRIKFVRALMVSERANEIDWEQGQVQFLTTNTCLDEVSTDGSIHGVAEPSMAGMVGGTGLRKEPGVFLALEVYWKRASPKLKETRRRSDPFFRIDEEVSIPTAIIAFDHPVDEYEANDATLELAQQNEMDWILSGVNWICLDDATCFLSEDIVDGIGHKMRSPREANHACASVSSLEERLAAVRYEVSTALTNDNEKRRRRMEGQHCLGNGALFTKDMRIFC